MIPQPRPDRDTTARRVLAVLSAWPYWPVVSHSALRRVLPGITISSVGDGMGMVAVAWLALQLAPGRSQGLWVAAAVAAYTLPGAAGAVALARLLAHRSGARLAGQDAALRALALGAAAAAAGAGTLSAGGYVVLLAVSSLLNGWGTAGKFTLVAERLPAEHRLAGNAAFSMLSTTGFIVGPAIAGVAVAAGGPALVIGIDAITFAVLAVSYLALPSASPRSPDEHEDGGAPPKRAPGFKVIMRNGQLLALTAVTCMFFLLYGPVEVALPIHVRHDLHGSAALLGAFWTLFAAGEVIGGLGAAYLRRWKLWPVTTGIILGWGICLLPTGASGSLGLALAGFATGGLLYAPFPATTMTLFQRMTPPSALAPVLAARGAITLSVPSLGEVLGGPLVTAIGAGPTLLVSATATIVLGAATGIGATATSMRRRRAR